VLKTALEAELSEHLGYDKHGPAGRSRGNSRNGTRTTTVLTDVGPVQLDVPRDHDASFEPPPGPVSLGIPRLGRLLGGHGVVSALVGERRAARQAG